MSFNTLASHGLTNKQKTIYRSTEAGSLQNSHLQQLTGDTAELHGNKLSLIVAFSKNETEDVCW